MPYPPPPGPPTVGFFQGIGKLIAPTIPDVTGHGGEFLETDGVIPQWEPVSAGALPDQAGHAGQFLTTDGATPSWATVPGGGQTLIVSVADFGAVPNDPTNDFALAWYACLASLPTSPANGAMFYIVTGVQRVAIYIPAGTYWSSVPLCLAGTRVGEVKVVGVGAGVAVICPGQGTTDSSPGNVQGFSGPVLYSMPGFTPAELSSPNLPQFTTPLVGATGQSLVLTESVFDGPNRAIRLHDSYAWGRWMGQEVITDWALEFWVRVDGPASGWIQGQKGIIGSRGPAVWTARSPNPTADMAFGVYAISDGVNVKLRAYLTTNPAFDSVFNPQASGTLYSVESANITLGTPVHVELDYDGADFWLYVNGVHQGHVAATGSIVRCPWEGVAMGSQGPELIESPQAVPSIEGAIDSIRMSRMPRHTGTSSFTPPSSKYAWDTTTMALYNWDQGFKSLAYGASTVTLPFLVGQTKSGVDGVTFSDVAMPHYIRLTGPHVAPDVEVSGLGITGWGSCSGVVAAYSDRNYYHDLWITQCSHFGLFVATGVSFYTNVERIYTFDVSGTGLQYFGEASDVNGVQCGIAVGIMSGRFVQGNYQPTYSSFAGLVVYDGGFPTEISWFSLDDEVWAFGRQIGGGVFCGTGNAVHFHDNFWGVQGSSHPPFLYLSLSPAANIVHQNDTFAPDRTETALCSALNWQGSGIPPTKVLLDNCAILDFHTPLLPISNLEGWVSVRTASQGSNQSGLSVSDEQANNLAGTFTISGTFTHGGVTFTTPERDGNYTVTITPQSFLGGVPAAGYNRITDVTTTASGFTAAVEVAPGGAVEVTYSYVIVRMPPPALYFDYLPVIPSSFTNPLDTVSSNVPFAIGVTLVPGTGDCIELDSSIGTQAILSDGTTPAASDFWEMALYAEIGMLSFYVGATNLTVDSQVFRGKYFNVHNPGAHNVVLYYPGTSAAPFVYLDGNGPIPIAGIGSALGVQQTPVHVGERFDASDPLTTITLKNLKVDTNPTRCISGDSAIGPGVLPQSLIFGDSQVIGQGSTSSIGGFATQLAQARYGSAYYWLGSRFLGSAMMGLAGTYQTVFKPWMGASTGPALNNFCLYPGTADIYSGATATDVMATLTKILEGEKASGTFTPPTSFTTPTDQRAILLSRVPASASAVYVINGRSFTVPFSVDSNTTVNNFIAQMVADGPTNTLFEGLNIFDPGSGLRVLEMRCRAPGSAGNAYVVTCDGGGGSFLYAGIGGGVAGVTLNGTFFNGSDTTCVINGVSFVCNFDTDANTTVNALITAIGLDPVIGPVVNCSLVSGKMFTEAATAGAAGNGITVAGNATNTPVIGLPWDTGVNHLLGGSNGIIAPLAVPNVVLCTCPPIADQFGATPGMVTELNALNALITAYAGAGVVHADVWTAVHDTGNADHLLPAYNSGGFLSDAGQVAVFNLLAPLLPGTGTPPSALSYASNPVTYASGAPIAPNNPTVTGSIVRWTVDPPLPTGLSVDSTTGVISGTPTTPTAAADYQVVATNTAGSVAVLVNITIT